MVEKFQTIERELQAQHLERKQVVRLVLTALLARTNLVLLGPPGTGKSRLARDLCRRIGGQFFEWLLGQMTTLEEVLGPISLRGLEEDNYYRKTTHKLPEAHIAFLDEVFKSSSALLNSLLGILNERVFHNDGIVQQVPLEMVIGASNELPENREDLAALWDRFPVRYVLDYLKDGDAFTAMLDIAATPAGGTTMTLDELHASQAEVAAIPYTDIKPSVLELREKLRQQGVVISDRRYHDLMRVLQANAWLNGHTTVEPGDCEILRFCLWNEPEQTKTVGKTVFELFNPMEGEAQEARDNAYEMYQEALSVSSEDSTEMMKKAMEANKGLQSVARRLKEVVAVADAQGKSHETADQALADIAKWSKEVMDRCMAATPSI